MRQVLIRIPTPFGQLPIFSFGMMLLVAFLTGTWLASRRARREKVPTEALWDIALYVFFAGIIGARLLHFILFPQSGDIWEQLLRFVRIWEGGLVFYGSLAGGLVGFVLAYFFIIRRLGLRTWQIADIIAPSIALGIFFGRIGCFLNGCCFGNVADPSVPSWLTVRFPPLSIPHRALSEQGYQTLLGFGVLGHDAPDQDSRTVLFVEPDTPAAHAGLKPGDVIVELNEQAVESGEQLVKRLFELISQASSLRATGTKMRLSVSVLRGEKILRPDTESGVASFTPPWSLPLYPTQLLSAVDGLLLWAFLSLLYPLRRRYGEIFAIFLAAYAFSRFFLEQLRSDTPRLFQGMTFSQLVSIGLLVVACALWLALYRWGTRPDSQ